MAVSGLNTIQRLGFFFKCNWNPSCLCMRMAVLYELLGKCYQEPESGPVGPQIVLSSVVNSTESVPLSRFEAHLCFTDIEFTKQLHCRRRYLFLSSQWRHLERKIYHWRQVKFQCRWLLSRSNRNVHRGSVSSKQIPLS